MSKKEEIFFSYISHLLTLCIFGLVVEARQSCQKYDISSDCPKNNAKREINLSTGCAIFYLNENLNSTYNILQKRDISCHYELETFSTDYGFHIYFDEMHIDTGEDVLEPSKCNGKCSDSVQFARDKLFIDTHHSGKYCGYREKVNFETASQSEFYRVQKDELGCVKRLYTEGIDQEMDAYFKIKKHSDRPNNVYNRTIRIVATVYKKSCGKNEKSWKQCTNTNQCIKKDFFCDGNPNCGWSQGVVPTDEIECEGYVVTYERHGGRNIASRIPVIIIVSIIGIGCFMLMFVVLRRCFKVYRVFQQPTVPKPPDDDESGIPLQSLETPNNVNNAIAQSEVISTNVRLSSDGNRGTLGRQSTLPSYDEAVQSPYVPNIRYADDHDQMGDPPPYTVELA